jgi:hypothetical protein
MQQAKRLAALRPGQAITSEIIPPDMSVPQNPVRLVEERWFGRWRPFAASLLNQNEDGE